MNDPATKQDVEILRKEMHERFEISEASMEGMRGQNSAEHGSIITKLLHIGELMLWLKSQWSRMWRASDGPPDSPPKP